MTAFDEDPDMQRAIAAAEAMGHRVRDDAPAAMTAVRRWTCDCGRAVLDNLGHVYGSATTERCTLPSTKEEK